MENNIDMWLVAHERTRQMNRFHSVQIDLKVTELDLYSIENIHNHFTCISKLVQHLKPNKRAYKTTFHPLTENKYCFPIREENYKNGKHSICSIVDDAKFFSFEDKELALSLIFEEDAAILKSIGYLKWDEYKLIEFMSNRLIKKTKLKTK